MAWGAAATLMALIYTLLLGIPAAITAPFFGGHTVTYIGRWWAWLIIRTAGIKVDFDGLDRLKRLGRYVLVSNHQSHFDIFAVLAFVPGEIRFVAKKELLKVPLVGYAMDRSGHILIDRKRGGQTIRKAIEVVRQGYNICIFAEGTRHSDGQVHPFSDGAAWLALAVGLPCVPMAVSGSATIFPRGSLIVTPGQRMKIRFGEPIATTGMRATDRFELTARLEHAVRDLLEATSASNVSGVSEAASSS
jgi:1-acyl-sn-glycerol-3-phosphate acyltransferase